MYHSFSRTYTVETYLHTTHLVSKIRMANIFYHLQLLINTYYYIMSSCYRYKVNILVLKYFENSGDHFTYVV